MVSQRYRVKSIFTSAVSIVVKILESSLLRGCQKSDAVRWAVFGIPGTGGFQFYAVFNWSTFGNFRCG